MEELVKKQNEMQPCYRKDIDNEYYTVYVSYDGKYKTIYNKTNHEILKFSRYGNEYITEE